MGMTEEEAERINRMTPETQKAALGSALMRLGGDSFGEGASFFAVRATITRETVYGTPFVVIPDEDIPEDKRIHILWFLFALNGSVQWTPTDALVYVGDSAVPPTKVLQFLPNRLHANNLIMATPTESSILAPYKLNTGLAPGMGLKVWSNTLFEAGSPIVVTLAGYIG